MNPLCPHASYPTLIPAFPHEIMLWVRQPTGRILFQGDHTHGYKIQSLLRVIKNEGLALYCKLTYGLIHVKIGYCGLNSDSSQNYSLPCAL